jgi:hypothetical protein
MVAAWQDRHEAYIIIRFSQKANLQIHCPNHGKASHCIHPVSSALGFLTSNVVFYIDLVARELTIPLLFLIKHLKQLDT